MARAHAGLRAWALLQMLPIPAALPELWDQACPSLQHHETNPPGAPQTNKALNTPGWLDTRARSVQEVGLSASRQTLLPSSTLCNPEAAPVNENVFFSFNETFLSFLLLPFLFQAFLWCPAELSASTSPSRGLIKE